MWRGSAARCLSAWATELNCSESVSAGNMGGSVWGQSAFGRYAAARGAGLGQAHAWQFHLFVGDGDGRQFVQPGRVIGIDHAATSGWRTISALVKCVMAMPLTRRNTRSASTRPLSCVLGRSIWLMSPVM